MSTLDLIAGISASYATVTIDLGDYDETYKGATFDVWVTPTRGHIDAYQAYYTRWIDPGTEQADEADEEREARRYAELDPWLAETWRNLSAEETAAVREHLQETNPRAWWWLYNKTLEVAAEYRDTLVKN